MSEIRQIGPHRIRCGSALDDLSDLMRGRKADVIWTDPPWGQGNLTYWGTIQRKMTGAEPPPVPGWPAFMDGLFQAYSTYAKNIVLINFGVRWRADIINRAPRFGFRYHGMIEQQYRSGSRLLPCDLHILYRSAPPGPSYAATLDGLYGLTAVRDALAPLVNPGDLIFDPCCGLGLAAQAAVDLGCVFYGNEINPARLRRTAQRLEHADKA